MKQNCFTSDRKYNLFDASVSHGQLLLRSQKGNSDESNIDIIFFGTTYIQLFTLISGIEITVVEDCGPKNIPKSIIDTLAYETNVVFKIKTKNEDYYIVASYMKVFENQLEFNQSSLGFDGKGREMELFKLPI